MTSEIRAHASVLETVQHIRLVRGVHVTPCTARGVGGRGPQVGYVWQALMQGPLGVLDF